MYAYILNIYITLNGLVWSYTSSIYISSDHIHLKSRDIDMRVTTRARRKNVSFYTKLLYWTKFSIVRYLRFSIFMYFTVLGVVMNDTEHCSVLLSIFSAQFWLTRFFLHARVVTLMSISLDLGCIWPDEMYIDEVNDHTRPCRVICMLSMHAYIEYVVILIVYNIIVAF